ncbi:ATP-binding cassette domain-containing protein [Staphylococcus americanisciuri]|uniref:ATP-binding cassette domain-containing protein n=1 Tax=Staphylococcus americanisciuri TaxID=2973940 RepID=A0ABT2F1H1_9STAP|nr:ATP-binding cassette domain-containing protein [Staphylococcus americanisciuri]MCS4486288.1 ATP-binding cassette domain-containing protein [Staphylococcus americanisciuri]
MIKMTHIYFSYKHIPILKDINLTIKYGETIGIVGESGSGKTTLAYLMLGLLQHDKGYISKNHTNILPIFQHPYHSFNPKLKIKTSLNEPIKYDKSLNSKTIYQRMETLMQEMQLNKKLLEHFPEELSGGQLQRFNTLRTLMLEPDMLICDEITSSLDVLAEQRMIHILKNYYERTNKGMILISHNIAFLKQIVNRMIVMKNGEIMDDFSVDQLFSQQRHPYTKQLISMY